MNISHHRFPAKLSVGATALIAAGSSAFAILNYDLRATSLNGVALAPALAHGGFPILPNDVIGFTVYAQVTGAAGNSGSEGFQAGFYNLISSTTAGETHGLFENPVVLPAFATGAFNAGTIDATGTRLGGPNTKSAQTVAPFDVTVRAGSTPAYNGTPILDGQEFALSTVNFRITQVGGGGTITMFPSIFTSGLAAARFSASWAEDTAGGVTSANKSSGFNGYTPAANAANTGTITVGCFICPEPSVFGMLFLGAVGIAGSRRICVRRQ